jgi:hypothetical protein
VNGVIVRLQPYSELRHKQLSKVNKEIDAFVDKNQSLTFRDMDRKKKAEFWMKKAQILWEPEPEFDASGELKNMIASHWDKKTQFFTPKFFEDEAFEYPLLQKTQVFFLNQEVFL